MLARVGAACRSPAAASWIKPGAAGATRSLFGSSKVHVPEVAADGTRNIDCEVYRWQGEGRPYTETFTVDTKDTPMILDVLIKIKNTQDPTLAFRRSCREGICGSCSMNINGKNMLACLCTLDQAISNDGKIHISPLPHQHVVRDLIPDMSKFYEHHKSVRPWLHLTPEQEKEKTEVLQTVEQRKKLDGLYECILCACCSTSCPSYWWHGNDSYLGPAILLQAYRWLSDSRDVAFDERVADLASDDEKVFACHTIMNCTACCPKHLKPDVAIAGIKNTILFSKTKALNKFPAVGMAFFDAHHDGH